MDKDVKGYNRVFVKGTNGGRARYCRIVAAKILGRKLLANEIVHHADSNAGNDSPENLIICNSQKYHNELHMLLEAKRASGHYNWRKCPYCKQYDNPDNMILRHRTNRIWGQCYHENCLKQYCKERYLKCKEKVSAYSKERYKNKREEICSQMSKAYHSNEKIRNRRKEYYNKNKDSIREKQRLRYLIRKDQKQAVKENIGGK